MHQRTAVFSMDVPCAAQAAQQHALFKIHHCQESGSVPGQDSIQCYHSFGRGTWEGQTKRAQTPQKHTKSSLALPKSFLATARSSNKMSQKARTVKAAAKLLFNNQAATPPKKERLISHNLLSFQNRRNNGRSWPRAWFVRPR